MDRETFENLLNWIASKGSIGQCPAPLFWLVNKVEQVSPHVIIEIGIGIGGGMKVWEQLLDPGDLYIGVDRRPKIEEEIFWDWRNSNRRIEIVIGDSTIPETALKVGEILSYRKVDFLYIDGSHSYEAAKADFKNYMPFVRSGGLVGFHDVESHLEQKTGEATAVKKFFDELGGRKETSSRWMRPYLGAPMILKGDSPLVRNCKEILRTRHTLTKDNDLICTGIWWKP